MDDIFASSTDNVQQYIRYEFQVSRTFTLPGGISVERDFVSHPSMQEQFPKSHDEIDSLNLVQIDGEMLRSIDESPPDMVPFSRESKLLSEE